MKIQAYGNIKDGKLTIRSRRTFDEELKSLEGKEVTITVEKYSKKRSVQQNRYYWASLRILSDYTGHSSDELHEVLKYKFLKKTTVVEKTGEVVEYLGSTANLKTVEFMEFMDRFISWAGEMGCEIPPPNTQFQLLNED